MARRHHKRSHRGMRGLGNIKTQGSLANALIGPGIGLVAAGGTTLAIRSMVDLSSGTADEQKTAAMLYRNAPLYGGALGLVGAALAYFFAGPNAGYAAALAATLHTAVAYAGERMIFAAPADAADAPAAALRLEAMKTPPATVEGLYGMGALVMERRRLQALGATGTRMRPGSGQHVRLQSVPAHGQAAF